MERKIWLQVFIGLADSNAPVIEYRRKLRLKSNALATHIKKLTAYRHELQAILDKEVKDEQAKPRPSTAREQLFLEQRKREEEAAAVKLAARKRELESRFSGEKEKLRGDKPGTLGSTPSATGDTEALGARDDSSEDE